MIIDIHTHFHHADGSLEPLLQGMDQAGIDIAVVSPVVRPGVDNAGAENAALREAIALCPERLIGFVGLIPYHADAPGLLREFVEGHGFRGLKLHPSVQGFYPSDPRIRPVIETAAELDIPILIHTTAVPIPRTRSKYDDPMVMDDVAHMYPNVVFIMAHGNPFGVAPAIAGKHPNVYMDTANTIARYARLIPGVVEDMMEYMGMVTGEHGSRKVLFGSDANPAKTNRFGPNLAVLRDLNLSEHRKHLIMGETAARLLHIQNS